jgi:magnesium-transporting ATPase (P-type)
MLTDCIPIPFPAQLNYNSVMPSEIRFISAVSAHSCAFRLRGVASAAYMPVVIAQGRASLEAATAASLFMASSCLSFSFFVLFSTATLSWTIPFVPVIGCMLHLQFVIPLVGLCMAMSDPDAGSMNRVPPKNDTSITFGRREGKIVYGVAVLKALPPAVLPQLLYMIAFGEFLLKFDPDLVASECSPRLQPGDWASVVRCAGLKEYTGEARNSAGVLALASLVMCTVVASTSFVHRTESIFVEPPWHRNHAWAFSVGLSLLFVTLFLRAMLEEGSLRSLPWYFYALFTAMPFLCLAWDFVLKKTEKKHYDRAEKLRRLQFETRYALFPCFMKRLLHLWSTCEDNS